MTNLFDSQSSSSPPTTSSSSRQRSSSSKKRSSALRKSSSASKKKSIKKTRKNVRINSPGNETRVYSLGSEERQMKKGPRRKKGPACGTGVFPCVHQGVVFDDEEEWNDYIQNLRTRNRGTLRTASRTPASHKNTMRAKLSAQGKWENRIPKAQRLYDLDTGEIHDITTYEPSKGKGKGKGKGKSKK
jgi:hypothetical protein